MAVSGFCVSPSTTEPAHRDATAQGHRPHAPSHWLSAPRLNFMFPSPTDGNLGVFAVTVCEESPQLKSRQKQEAAEALSRTRTT